MPDMRIYDMANLIGVTLNSGVTHFVTQTQWQTTMPKTLCGIVRTKEEFEFDWQPGTSLPDEEICLRCRGYLSV